MKRLPLHVCVLVGVVLIGIVVPKVRAHLVSVDRYSLWLDPAFSQETQAALTKTFSTIAKRSACSANQIFNDFAPYGNLIANIEVQRYPRGVLHIALHAVCPCATINGALAVTDAGLLVPVTAFMPWIVKRIPPFAGYTYDVTAMPQAFVHCLPKLIALSGVYTVYWKSAREVWLTSKQQPHVSIVCTADSMPSNGLLAHCQQLGKQLCEQNSTVALHKKNDRHWIADVRFAGQIVTYTHGKEELHGQNIY